MQNPLVSILIPTYNQPEYFRFTLESAIAQTYKNIEILVSDDSTDDRVRSVFEEYKNCGRNIKYLKHGEDYTTESTGERSLLNMENLLEHARGEFVNILFHDDLIYPNKISTMMEYFKGELKDQISIVSSVRDVIDEKGNFKFLSDVLEVLDVYQNDESIILSGETAGRLMLLVCGNFVGELSTVLMRRKDFYRECIEKFSPGYFFGVKDRTMWDISTYLEVCKNGSAVIFLRESLNAFRMAGGNQNTYNGNIRMQIIVDWLQLVAIAFLNDTYIHNPAEFKVACRYWLHIASGMIKFFKDFPNTKMEIDLNLLDQIMNAVESVEKEDFDITLSIGVEWIQKYSGDTFEIRS